ncbi:hypothetical protein M0805_004327 [Coniferiporia weirii]|nr:hypothetical protein M0805_004327 [Coniferiporia weirii]
MAGLAELLKSLNVGKDMDTAPSGDQVRMDQIWDVMLKQLKELSSATVEKNIELTTRVTQLEEELQVWKQARSVTVDAAERDRRQYEDEKLTLQRRINDLEAMQDSMILCVIDGDGNIFNDHLLSAGLEGGREAARTLTSGIADYLQGIIQGQYVQGRFTFWLSIYFNRRGLQDTLVKSNVCTLDQFEAFLVGFSQASPRFLLVDVGHGKEAADAKIKEYLQTYTRFPQTKKVFFGGGHDNGYLPTLTALENERLLDKLVILKGYRDIATELKALRLPTLSLDNLFRADKLAGSPRSKFPSTSAPVDFNEDIHSFIRPISVSSNGSGPRSNDSGQFVYRQRLIDCSVPLAKQNPPPCNEFYLLKKCPRGVNCKYGHEYALTTDHILQLANNAKKSPCGAARKGIKCSFGNRCIWGHVCPKGPTCMHLLQGRCWFKGANAHAGISNSLFGRIETSEHDDEADLHPSETPGYKVNSPAKSPEEYAQMDANDESLARWKASLGIGAGGESTSASGPKVTVLSMELVSPTLPPGKTIVLDLTNHTNVAEAKKNPITIKEGVEYNVLIRFIGVKYIQVVKRAGIKVDKLEQMLGSYGPSQGGEPYVKNFPTEESPSGMVARSGTYSVKSRVVDDDKEVYADFEWAFKLAKEW